MKGDTKDESFDRQRTHLLSVKRIALGPCFRTFNIYGRRIRDSGLVYAYQVTPRVAALYVVVQ